MEEKLSHGKHLTIPVQLAVTMSDTSQRDSRRKRVLASLYDYSSTIAESKPGSNRGLAAGTAATILAMSIELMERRSKNGEEMDFEFTEEEAEAVRNMALSAEEHANTKEQAHFVDRFMERLVKHTMSDGSEDSENISSRVSDPSRVKRPPLSLRILTSNMKRLAAKMGAFFKLQYGAIHIITWRKPTKTLTVLVLYTAVCLWPHLVLALPLIFILFGIMIPAFLYRHPMDSPELIKVHKRGQTLLDFLNESTDSSVIMDMLDERIPDDDVLAQFLTTSSSDSCNLRKRLGSASVSVKTSELDDEINKKDKTKFVKSQVSLLMNMRDLQNLTTELLNYMDQGENLANDVFGFKDERLTTFIFYILIAVTTVVLFLGKYIPWRMIFIQSGWAFMILCHPNTKKYLVALSKNTKSKKPDEVVIEKKEEIKKSPTSIFEGLALDRHDIIVDDQPQVRIVEIFELQKRDVLKYEWTLYAYTKRLFDFKDSVRVSGKLPHGVDSLLKVLPPPEWKYDFAYANNWRIDQNPTEFLRARRIDQKYLRCPENLPDGWIYDRLPESQDSSIEFRRRRLYRECYRCARPPKPVSL